ncbi:MAG TPA: PQQ-binding-like beta-propeller repeat protein [Pirellulales bacterium]|nr:PQQ-binding-like beta-propeller repeat protein [Pirellulales bacterium]
MSVRRLFAVCMLLDMVMLQPLVAAEPMPETEWLFVEEGGRAGLSDPVVVDGMVLVGSDTGLVRAFEAKTGEEIWRHSHGARVHVRPEFDDEHVYVCSERVAEALNRRDGKIVWSHSAPKGFGAVAVAPAARLLILCGYDGIVRAVDTKTAAQKWAASIVKDAPADRPGFNGGQARFQEIDARPTAAVCDDRWVFVSIFDQSRVVGFDIASGTKKFDYQAGGWIFHAPLVDGDHVFIGSQDQALHCVERATSKPVWSFQTRSRIESSAAVDGNRVYIGSCDGGFYCVDRDSGEEKWRFEIETGGERTKAIYSDPLIFDDTVCFAAGEGQLYALDLVSGALRWKYRPLAKSELFTSPASDGRLIFVTSRPNLAIDDRAVAGKAALIAIDPAFQVVDPFERKPTSKAP